MKTTMKEIRMFTYVEVEDKLVRIKCDEWDRQSAAAALRLFKSVSKNKVKIYFDDWDSYLGTRNNLRKTDPRIEKYVKVNEEDLPF